MPRLLTNPKLQARYDEKDNVVVLAVIFAALKDGGESAAAVGRFVDTRCENIEEAFRTADNSSIGICQTDENHLDCRTILKTCDEGRALISELEHEIENLQGITQARTDLVKSFEKIRITARAA